MAEPRNPIEISDTARDEMESICRRATGGQDVERGVLDELYGHLEDKLIGYLNGEERLTEADAMILVREHFGRPETLRPILVDVHAPPDVPRLPIWRRFAAAAIVLSAATIGVVVFRVAVVLTPALWMYRRGSDLAWLKIWFWTAMILGILATAGCLFQARRRWLPSELAKRSWISRWKPYTLAVTLVALLLMSVILGQASFRAYRSTGLPEAAPAREPAEWVVIALVPLTFAAVGLQCLAWIACIASPARGAWWTPIVAALAWVLYFPAWKAAEDAVRLAAPGVWSAEFNPLTYFWEAGIGSVVAGPALAVYLVPRLYRWFKVQGPPRVRWASGSSAV